MKYFAFICSIAYLVSCPVFSEDYPYKDYKTRLSDLDKDRIRKDDQRRIELIRKITKGVSGESVLEALGSADEIYENSYGLQWNYNVEIPFAGDSGLICLFKVVFDDSHYVTSFFWKHDFCKSLYDDYHSKNHESHKILSLSADVLFEFNESSLGAEGKKALEKVAEDIVNNYKNPSIAIVGHADRLGQEGYNEQLSYQRALAVKKYLLSIGVPSNFLDVSGVGESQPVVSCDGLLDRQDLIDCLSKNRRVDILVKEK